MRFNLTVSVVGGGRVWSPSMSTLGVKEEVASEMGVCGRVAVD